MVVARTTMKMFNKHGRLWGLALWLGASVLIVSGGGALAHAADGHPARIHEGSCENIGKVDFQLTGVGASVDLNGAPLATPAAVNPADSFQVMVSETTLDAPMRDVVSGDHAVMVYDDDENMQAVACGNLGGAMDGDTLIAGLGEVRIPGHLGFAIFTPDGDKTHVELIIGHAMAPVSASGASMDHGGDMASMDMGGEEESHGAMATPTP
jgi:hypothetical protein